MKPRVIYIANDDFWCEHSLEHVETIDYPHLHLSHFLSRGTAHKILMNVNIASQFLRVVF